MAITEKSLLSEMAHTAPIGICLLDAATLVSEMVNNKFLEIAGKSREQIFGKFYWDAFSEARPFYEKALSRVVATGEPYQADEVELMLIRHGKEELVFVTFVYMPVNDDKGKISKIAIWVLENTRQVKIRQAVDDLNDKLIGSNEKITAANEELLAANDALVAITQELTESEARFRSLAEGSEVMISVNDVDGNVEYINKAWLNLVGKSKEEMFAYGWGDFLHPDDQERLLAEFRKGIESKLAFTVEFRMIDKKGEPRWIYTRVNPRLLKNGTYDGTISSSIDVTDQVTIRNEISDINERLNIALDAGNFGTTEVDLATGNMLCNTRFKSLFGRNEDQKITYPEMFEAMMPEFREYVKERAIKAQQEHSLYEATYQVKWPDGSIHWLEAHGRARYDKNGKADRMVGIIADVTNQKADEQRKNDFIGMVSHELKTPITSLNAYLQVLLAKSRKLGDEFTSNALYKSVLQVKKMTNMINGFLNVSRLESGKIHINLQKFDMALLMQEIQEELRLTVVSHQIEFLPCRQTHVTADKDKISNVVNNLISNAVKYSANGTNIYVECKKTDDGIQLSVKDQGVGISSNELPKLFERYYRTESAVNSSTSGFGIGLYLSAEIIERHHGKIWAQSELGKGSTFYFTLPLNDL